MPNPHETARRATKARKLVATMVRLTPGATAAHRFADATRLPAMGWTMAETLAGTKVSSATTRDLVLSILASSAIVELSAEAHHRGEGGEFACLALGCQRAAIGLSDEAALICGEAHDALVAEAERLRGAA